MGLTQGRSTGHFCHRDHPQQLDQRRYLRAATRARLDPRALWLLDAD